MPIIFGLNKAKILIIPPSVRHHDTHLQRLTTIAGLPYSKCDRLFPTPVLDFGYKLCFKKEGCFMDKGKTPKRGSFFDGIISGVRREAERRRAEHGALVIDVTVFLVSLFFARCHIAFGAYPLATALVATLPSRVWVALIGALFGSLSLGGSGLLHAIILVITVFLRIIISGGARDEDGTIERLFSEPYVMRVASCAIGSFIGAFYQVLLDSFSLSSVLFGSAGVLLTVALAFSFFGVFTSDIDPIELFGKGRRIFSGKRSERESMALVLFQMSSLVLVFFSALSLDGYDFFGISLCYVFVGAITLFVARRFGAIRAGVVGFVGAIGISANGAVAFALAGLGSGVLFSIGLSYALFGGGALLCAWCAYAGGLTDFLSTLPEYGIAAMLMTPYLKGAKRESEPDEVKKTSLEGELAADEAVRRRRDKARESDSLESALILAAGAIKEYGQGSSRGEFDEYRNIVIAVTSALDPTPCEEKIDAIASKLYKGDRIFGEDISRIIGDLECADVICDEIMRLSGDYERECYERSRMDAVAGEYEIISRLISEGRLATSRSFAVNDELSKRLSGILASLGFPEGCVRALGEGAEHIVIAADEGGGLSLSSARVLDELGRALGSRLEILASEKHGNITVLECKAAPVWKIECSTASSPSPNTGLSGDSAHFVERDGVFHSLICDGMGSGAVAMRTSRFACRFLGEMLKCGNESLVLDSLGGIIKHRGEECSTTVDIFSFDLVTGDASFVKCGAAPSYVKHGDSIYRIRSRTAPVGLSSTVDSEQVVARVEGGDYVVMLSDGVSVLPDEVPWLLEFLAKPTDKTADEYARELLSLALENSKTNDDLTVSVMRVLAA